MIKLFGRGVSALAVTVMLGGLSLAHPAYAVDDTVGVNQTQSDVKVNKGLQHVNERIGELHEKLGVTANQETKWKPVASIIRENEATIHRLVEARNNKENMNAVQDLKSYEKIAAAHEQGLKKLVPAFEKFYNSLSEDQKKTADNMFSSYEDRNEEKTGNVEKFHNIQPSSGESDTTNTNGVNSNVNNGTMNNAPAVAPTNDTGATENPSNTSNTTNPENPSNTASPSDQPVNPGETK